MAFYNPTNSASAFQNSYNQPIPMPGRPAQSMPTYTPLPGSRPMDLSGSYNGGGGGWGNPARTGSLFSGLLARLPSGIIPQWQTPVQPHVGSSAPGAYGQQAMQMSGLLAQPQGPAPEAIGGPKRAFRIPGGK